MTRILTSCAVLGTVLALTACGAGSQRPAAEKTLKANPGQNGTVAEAVLASNGGALTVTAADVVRLSANAGQSWSGIRLPSRPATGHSVWLRAQQVDALTVGATGLSLQRSVDGGHSWRATAVPLSTPTDQADLAVSADGSRVAVLARVQGNANNGDTPELFVGAATGSLTPQQAPASGAIAWSGGQLLLAGGPLSSRLYVSPDQGASWAAQPIAGQLAPRFDVSPEVASIGAPLSLDGLLTVPVTSHAGASSVQLYRGASARALGSPISVPLTSKVGSGVAAVVSAAGPAELVVAEPGSATLHLVSATHQSTISPKGLPGPVDALSFSDAEHGLAQVTVRSCAGSKQSCAEQVELLSTQDGGRTWSATS